MRLRSKDLDARLKSLTVYISPIVAVYMKPFTDGREHLFCQHKCLPIDMSEYNIETQMIVLILFQTQPKAP